MMAVRNLLLVLGAEHHPSVLSAGVDTHRQALPLLSESVQGKREHKELEPGIALLHSEEGGASKPQPLTAAAHAFLVQYVSPAVLEVFPEWQGILLESPMLEEATWVVRNHQTGQRLAQKTGQPSLCLDEILAQEGHSCQKTQDGPFSQRAAGGKNEATSRMQKSRGIGDEATPELTPRQEEAIAALLTGVSVQGAATRLQIGRTTLYRWLKDETFRAAYQKARRQPRVWVPGRLQRLVGKAVHTLEHSLDDPAASPTARINAARTVLEFTALERELHPETNCLETVTSRRKPQELSREQGTTNEGYDDEDAKDLGE